MNVWWLFKVVSQLGLLGYVIWASATGTARWWVVATWLPGLVVGMPALWNTWHFVLLKRGNASMARPDQLHTTGGALPWIRHPMYAGDCVLAIALWAVYPNSISLAIGCAVIAGALMTALGEDAELAERYGAEHKRWRRQAGLLLPKLRLAK